jgi:hypothetical protein
MILILKGSICVLVKHQQVKINDLKSAMQATDQRVIESKVERKNKFDFREKKDKFIAKLLTKYPPLRQKTSYGSRVGVCGFKTYDPGSAALWKRKQITTSQNHIHCAISLDN